jgi:hypothetical protein
MLIKYKGGRTHLRVTYGRRQFSFSPENKFTLDITEQPVRDFIFQLPNCFEFEAVDREPLQEVNTIKKENVILKKENKNDYKRP